MEGRLAHKSTHVEKLPKLSTTVPGDSNAFQVSQERGGVKRWVGGVRDGVGIVERGGVRGNRTR